MNIHTFFRKAISVIAFATLLVISFVAGKFLHRIHDENQLKNADINVKLEMIRAENNKLIGQNKVIQLSLAQLEAFYPAIHSDIKKMGVKPSRVQSVSNTGVVLENKIITTLRDSVIHDSVHVKKFNYSDAWISIKGEAIGNKQSISITHYDTLIQVIFKGARTNPWLWVFSPRKLTQRISLASPYSKLNYAKTIELYEK